ncbi:MAG: oligopeptide/dipeptide ABC transporter ATP-binding protein [Gammaproteobacteria bacterium]
MPLLEVDQLVVRFDTPDGEVEAVNGISFSLEPSEVLAIVGESGSGKSQSMLAIMGLLAANGRCSGSVRYRSEEILNLPTAQLNEFRGDRISMIFQDPMTSLNPYLTIAKQMVEVLVLHKGMSEAEARRTALEMLDAVHIPDARGRIDRYPHEFSGGMRQRVMIAIALLCRPDLLIADEPTTALDVTVQAQILELLSEIRREFGTAIILITHDLGVVAGSSDRALVMYGGQLMEYGTLDEIFHHSRHPYTRGLLRSVPRLDQPGLKRLQTIPGNPPSLLALPAGCPFASRCEYREPRCLNERPAVERLGESHLKACHRSMLP